MTFQAEFCGAWNLNEWEPFPNTPKITEAFSITSFLVSVKERGECSHIHFTIKLNHLIRVARFREWENNVT
jgi:hypothetical protein